MSRGVAEGAGAGTGERELAAGSSAANGQGIAVTRRHESFILESLQRRVNRANRVVTPSPLGEVVTYGKAVRGVVESGNREQRCEL
jgi:hypothetical protein